MTGYRVTNIITLFVLAAMLLAHNLWAPLPWWLFVLVPLAYAGLCAWGSMNIASGFYMPVTCAAATQQKVVALTFDDGPAQRFTPQVLDILQQLQAPAAFFCIGKNAAANKDLLQRAHAEGHVLGNHSYSHHFWFDLFGHRRMLAELQQTDDVLQQAIGKRPRLFRPPYGVTNPNLRKAVQRGGYIPLGWNIRSMDTVIKDAGELQRITSRLQPGAVILLHDTMEVTLQALPALIADIRRQGYTIERIDKMLNIPAYV